MDVEGWACFPRLKHVYCVDEAERLERRLTSPERLEGTNDPMLLSGMLHNCIRKQRHDLDFISVLFRHGASLHSLYYGEDKGSSGWGKEPDNIVHSMVQFWHDVIGPDVLKRAWEDGVAFNDRGLRGDKPLQIAFDRDNWVVIGLLLKYGAEVDMNLYRMVWYEGKQSLKIVEKYIKKDTAKRKLLKEWKNNLKLYKKHAAPAPDPLTKAIYAKNHSYARHLLAHGMSPHTFVRYPIQKYSVHCYLVYWCEHRTPILTIAVLEEAWPTVKALVEHGADVNAVDARGNTALHAAFWRVAEGNCFGDNYAGAEFLLRAGANVDALNVDGDDPFNIDSRCRIEALHDLGNCCADVGHLENAQMLYLKTINALLKQPLKAVFQILLQTVCALCRAYRRDFNPERAEDIFDRAYVRFRKKLGETHAATIAVLYLYASFYTQIDLLDDAESMFIRALEGYTKSYPSNMLFTLSMIMALTNAHREAGRFDFAEQWNNCVAEWFVEGDEYYVISRAGALANHGRICYPQGLVQEAAAAWERALWLYEEASTLPPLLLFPDIHPEPVPLVIQPFAGKYLVALYLDHLYREQGWDDATGRVKAILQESKTRSLFKGILNRLRTKALTCPDRWLLALLEQRVTDFIS